MLKDNFGINFNILIIKISEHLRHFEGCVFFLIPFVAIIAGFLTDSFLIFITLFVGLIMLLIFSMRNKTVHAKKRYQFLDASTSYTTVLLQLVAIVIKADGKTKDSELKYIERALEGHYDSKKTRDYMNQIKKIYLRKELSLRKIAYFLRDNYTATERIQIIHLVTGIATADGILTKSEMETLRKIAKSIGVTYKLFNSILGMFHFKKEWIKDRKKTHVRRSSYTIDTAYQILAINKSVSDNKVKKAYRKLAFLNHPDKFVHLGKEYQNAAKEKFQKIVEAYEIIKKRRGFS